MNFKTVQRQNPMDRDSEKLYYPAPQYSGEVDIDQIAEEISNSASLTIGDVKSTLEHFLAILPKYLKMGMKLKLNSFGRIKIVFGGRGRENENDVTADDIRDVRIGFIADAKMKRAIGNISFKKISNSDEKTRYRSSF